MSRLCVSKMLMTHSAYKSGVRTSHEAWTTVPHLQQQSGSQLSHYTTPRLDTRLDTIIVSPHLTRLACNLKKIQQRTRCHRDPRQSSLAPHAPSMTYSALILPLPGTATTSSGDPGCCHSMPTALQPYLFSLRPPTQYPPCTEDRSACTGGSSLGPGELEETLLRYHPFA